jgi:hypothetical protein
MTTFRRRLTGLLAAVLLVGIIVGLPATLLSLGGNPLPNQLPSLSDLSEALTSPDDGTLAVAAITLIGWAAWLILAGAIVVEATSRLRGITTPALPGLRLPQLAARNLVTAALLLFTAAPLLVQHAGEAAAEPVVSPAIPSAQPTPSTIRQMRVRRWPLGTVARSSRRQSPTGCGAGTRCGRSPVTTWDPEPATPRSPNSTPRC